jgi:hypothetical protein
MGAMTQQRQNASRQSFPAESERRMPDRNREWRGNRQPEKRDNPQENVPSGVLAELMWGREG